MFTDLKEKEFLNPVWTSDYSARERVVFVPDAGHSEREICLIKAR